MIKFRKKVKCNRLTAQPFPCAFFGLKYQCLCTGLLSSVSICSFDSLVNFGRKGEVLE